MPTLGSRWLTPTTVVGNITYACRQQSRGRLAAPVSREVASVLQNPSQLPALSLTQLEIMNVIWERTECSVTDVWKVLRLRRDVSRNTIHTLIVRLEEKGWLEHQEAENGTFLYRASVSQLAAQRRSVQDLVKTVFNGSAEGLVLTLLDGGAISPAESERIKKMISAAKRKKS